MAYIDPEDRNVQQTPEELRQAYDFDNANKVIKQTTVAVEDLTGFTEDQLQIISENFVQTNESLDSINQIVGETVTVVSAQGETIISNTTAISELEQTVNGLEFTQSKMGGSNMLDNSAKIYGANQDGWTYSVGYDGSTETDVTNTSISGKIQYLGDGYEQVEQDISNNLMTVSFYYKKVSPTATASLNLNNLDEVVLGNETEWTLYYQNVQIENGKITIKFACDETNGYYYRDLMVNLGDLAFPWSQSLNETYTDTVRIGGGAVEVISTASETTTKISAASGLEILDKNTNEVVAFFDKKGLNSNEGTFKTQITLDKLRINGFAGGYAFTIND